MKIDWVQKLSSRKFWALIAGFVTSLLVLFNVGEGDTTRIVALITAMGSVVGYMLSEAYVDGKREDNMAWEWEEEYLEDDEDYEG